MSDLLVEMYEDTLLEGESKYKTPAEAAKGILKRQGGNAEKAKKAALYVANLNTNRNPKVSESYKKAADLIVQPGQAVANDGRVSPGPYKEKSSEERGKMSLKTFNASLDKEEKEAIDKIERADSDKMSSWTTDQRSTLYSVGKKLGVSRKVLDHSYQAGAKKYKDPNASAHHWDMFVSGVNKAMLDMQE